MNSLSPFEYGLQLFQNGQLEAAKQIFLEQTKLKPKDPETWHLLGIVLYQLGSLKEAQNAIQQAISLNPQAHEYYFNLGNVLLDLGLPQETETHWRQALALKPDFVDLYSDLSQLLIQLEKPEQAAVVLIQLGRYFESIQQLESALNVYQYILQLQPNQPNLLKQMGILYFQLQQYEKAEHYLEQAGQLAPHDAEILVNLSTTLIRLKKYSPALTTLAEAISLNPAYKNLYFAHAEELLATNYGDIALLFYEKAREVTPPSERFNIHARLMQCYQYTGRHYDAEEALNEALKLQPDASELKIFHGTYLPNIYESRAEMLVWREHFTHKLQELHQAAFDGRLKARSGQFAFLFNTFTLTYQGFDDRDLNHQFAEMFYQYAQIAELQKLLKSHPHPLNRAKTRIGILSCFLWDHSVMNCFRGLILLLAEQPGFEVVCFYPKQNPRDHVTDLLKSKVFRFIDVDSDFGPKGDPQVVLDQQLDILIYTDIGLEMYTFMMASLRLAPIQCVLSGQPTTTGIKNIDYYISTALMETQNASAYYTEKLICLKDLPSAYPKPALPQTYKTRQELGWDETHVYLCPMSLIKMHPDFDAVVAEILRLDPNGKCCFFRLGDTNLDRLLMARFQRTIPDVVDRIYFNEWVAKSDFLQILYHADVVLDTIHFGGGNTNFLTLAVGSPLITWPNEFLRGRSAYGMYQLMQLFDCIADKLEDYAPLAVKIATNPELRSHIRQQILAKNHVLFDNQSGNEELVGLIKQWSKNGYH